MHSSLHRERICREDPLNMFTYMEVLFKNRKILIFNNSLGLGTDPFILKFLCKKLQIVAGESTSIKKS